MTEQQTFSVEAVKLIKDWSVWMVAVQTALIAYIAKETAPLFGCAEPIALGSFAVSILAAAWVLSGLPYILLCLPDEENPNIYYMKLTSFPLLGCVPLCVMAFIQHLAFAVGLVSLIAGRVLCGNA